MNKNWKELTSWSEKGKSIWINLLSTSKVVSFIEVGDLKTIKNDKPYGASDSFPIITSWLFYERGKYEKLFLMSVLKHWLVPRGAVIIFSKLCERGGSPSGDEEEEGITGKATPLCG